MICRRATGLGTGKVRIILRGWQVADVYPYCGAIRGALGTGNCSWNDHHILGERELVWQGSKGVSHLAAKLAFKQRMEGYYNLDFASLVPV